MTTLEHTAAERSTHARTLGEMFRRSAQRAADTGRGLAGRGLPRPPLEGGRALGRPQPP